MLGQISEELTKRCFNIYNTNTNEYLNFKHLKCGDASQVTKTDTNVLKYNLFVK